MKNLTLSALTALGLSAGALHAAPFVIDYQDPNDVFGSQGWFSSVTIDSPVFDGTFNAGQFELSSADLGAFFAFCIEVTQAIADGNTYEDTPNLFDQAVISNIEGLFNSAYDLVVDGLTAAGFQVALWEIVEDTSIGLDLSAGTFSAVDASTVGGSVVGTAQGFLDGLATAPTGLYEISLFASPTSQDVVTASRIAPPSPVPLPASGLLLLSAGGLLMLRRQKRSA